MPVGNVVVAAGVWSRRLAAMLGTKVPLEAERGYHAMFRDTGVAMNGGIISVDRHLAVTPMAEGVRSARSPSSRRRKRRRTRGSPRASAPWRGALSGPERRRVSEWVGPRPSHPDSRPAIGRSPRFPNAYFAFGHDHLGLTMGGITGRLIAELAAGRTPSVDLAPFRPTGSEHAAGYRRASRARRLRPGAGRGGSGPACPGSCGPRGPGGETRRAALARNETEERRAAQQLEAARGQNLVEPRAVCSRWMLVSAAQRRRDRRARRFRARGRRRARGRTATPACPAARRDRARSRAEAPAGRRTCRRTAARRHGPVPQAKAPAPDR